MDADVSAAHAAEVKAGARFEFGENWRRFLSGLSERQICAAREALAGMLEVESLHGKSFVDVGSGSGLSSLAAFQLGARVHSFDFDPSSVACTMELRRRFAGADAARWVVEQGSVLDTAYLARLGQFDVVYSWGVLHHTGRMWEALGNVDALAAPRASLFVAIYNDEGTRSARWRVIKRTYNRLPGVLRAPFAAAVSAPGEAKAFLRLLVKGRVGDYFSYSDAGDVNERGMTRWRDIVDWVGGYPYEVATPEAIFDFYKDRHYGLTKMKCGNVGSGCNEFVFRKNG